MTKAPAAPGCSESQLSPRLWDRVGPRSSPGDLPCDSSWRGRPDSWPLSVGLSEKQREKVGLSW